SHLRRWALAQGLPCRVCRLIPNVVSYELGPYYFRGMAAVPQVKAAWPALVVVTLLYYAYDDQMTTYNDPNPLGLRQEIDIPDTRRLPRSESESSLLGAVQSTL